MLKRKDTVVQTDYSQMHLFHVALFASALAFTELCDPPNMLKQCVASDTANSHHTP